MVSVLHLLDPCEGEYWFIEGRIEEYIEKEEDSKCHHIEKARMVGIVSLDEQICLVAWNTKCQLTKECISQEGENELQFRYDISKVKLPNSRR